MNNISLKLIASMVFVIFGVSSPLMAVENPNDILSKSEDVRRNGNITADVILKTTGPDLNDEKTFTFFRKLADDKERFKTLTRFKTPLTIKNQGILFLEKENYENSIYMYLPNFKKIRRVESHSQSTSFMGSAFSYSDISTPLQKDYKSSYLKQETCPLDSATKCHVIESKPKNEDVKERTGYSKQIFWIRTSDYLPEKTELYQDENNDIRKRMLISQCQKTTGQKWFCEHLEVEDLKTKKRTVLKFTNVNSSKDLSDSLFTQQSLSSEK